MQKAPLLTRLSFVKKLLNLNIHVNIMENLRYKRTFYRKIKSAYLQNYSYLNFLFPLRTKLDIIYLERLDTALFLIGQICKCLIHTFKKIDRNIRNKRKTKIIRRCTYKITHPFVLIALE